jgi:hypothetical protein
MSAPKPAPTMVSVYGGTICLGHVLYRPKVGFETFDVDDRSLGIFKTQAEAARALPDRSKP